MKRLMPRTKFALFLIPAIIVVVIVVVEIFVRTPVETIRIAVDVVVVQEAPLGEYDLLHIDLSTHDTQLLFDAPSRSEIGDVTVSPDGARVAFSMTTPLGRTGDQVTRSGIYTVEIAQPGVPELVLGTDDRSILYDSPRWSPDGESLYFIETNLTNPTAPAFILNDHHLATATTTIVIIGATSPQISPDGTQIVYIGTDEVTQQRGIYLMDANGTNTTRLVDDPTLFDLRTPVFSLDGESIYFSAIKDDFIADVSLLHDVFGIAVAQAHPGHVSPSEWWLVPVIGGEVERLSQQSGSFAIYSADLDAETGMLIFVSNDGLFALSVIGEERASPLIMSDTYRTLAVMP